MPRWLVSALLVVFAVHLVAFGRLAAKRRELRFVVVTVTFALLVIAFSLRLWAPRLTLGGVALYWFPRVAAWISAAVSLALYVRHRRRR